MTGTGSALEVAGCLDATVVRALEALVTGRLRAGAQVVTCELADVPADLTTVDALARLQLTAQRSGGSVRFRGVTADLADLLGLAGLEALLER